MDWRKAVDRFCYQYLQLETDPDLPPPEVVRLAEVQDAIYEKLFADGAVQYGPPTGYQLLILKRLIARIESSIEDWDAHGLSDDLMSTMAQLLITPQLPEAEAAQQKSYVTYHLSELQDSNQDANVTILENRSLIAAGGTTGLRTWEAALHMGQYLCQNKELVSGKRILELGAGTGYLSILCAKHLAASHVIASDGSDDVINNLPENLFLNSLEDENSVQPMDLKWGHMLAGTEEEKWNGGRAVDVVVGADITYDKSVIPALIATIVDLLDIYPDVQVYITATQRNEATLNVFLEQCKVNGLATQELEYKCPKKADQTGPFYNDQVAIMLYCISRRK